jgi:hypothetical protein
MEIEYAPGFEKSWDKLFHWKYAPLRWYKAIVGIPRDIKWFYQRGTRGWADCDWWSIDSYLAGIISPMVRELRLKGIGYQYPPEVKDITAEEMDKVGSEWWKGVLQEIEEGFALHKEDKIGFGSESVDTDEAKANRKKFNRAKELFIEYFEALWD